MQTRLDRRRYEELKRFCHGYPIWKYELENFSMTSGNRGVHQARKGLGPSDPTGGKALKRIEYGEKIRMVETAAKRANPDIWSYLIDAAANDYSYEHARYQEGVKVKRDVWDDGYNRFFLILSGMKLGQR